MHININFISILGIHAVMLSDSINLCIIMLALCVAFRGVFEHSVS